jgi:hypothetical protein
VSEAKFFVPDSAYERKRLAVVEDALGRGGLIDRHLHWLPVEASPSASISRIDYGHLPTRFSEEEHPNGESLRPRQEPIDYQSIATNVLGMPYDGPQADLVGRIAQVESEWFQFLIDKQFLSPKQVDAMKRAASGAYTLDTLTEDNLPAYVSALLGVFVNGEDNNGLLLPATNEWVNIWKAEEYGHSVGMNAHGFNTGLTNSPEHVAGRNSQLRAGMDVELTDVTKTFAYVAWQELSTNYAHKRNGDLLGPVGNALMSEISSDEAKHHKLYLSALDALLQQFPDDTVRVLHDVLAARFMPGSRGIPNFRKRSIEIHNSAVFGADHAQNAACSVLQKLNLLDPEAEERFISDEAKIALGALQEAFQDEEVSKRRNNIPFVLGRTITGKELREARKAYSEMLGLPKRARRSQKNNGEVE